MHLRDKLLDILKNNSPGFVSGEQACRQLGVSRTAVWKQVNSLREMGYSIESRSNAGYRLVSVPDRLYAGEVAAQLDTGVIGREIKYFPHLDSTNQYAKQWAGEGAPDGSVVVAEEQGTGKGRMGRGWYSPEGKGLWFSVVLRPRVSAVEVSKITLLAAVAVARAVYRNTGCKPGIKWPNDLLAGAGGSRKMCGILTEMNADMDRVNFVVLGIGLNVNIFKDDIPPELDGIITSVGLETGRREDRVYLLRSVLEELDFWYKIWPEHGFAPVLQQWKEWNITLGRRVKITTVNEVVEGTAEDIDEKGSLLLRLENGERREFLVGEVSLR